MKFYILLHHYKLKKNQMKTLNLFCLLASCATIFDISAQTSPRVKIVEVVDLQDGYKDSINYSYESMVQTIWSQLTSRNIKFRNSKQLII